MNFWHNTFITGEGEITIGKGTYMGQHTYISANPVGSKLIIGKNCAIYHNVKIRTGSYDTIQFIKGERVAIYSNIHI